MFSHQSKQTPTKFRKPKNKSWDLQIGYDQLIQRQNQLKQAQLIYQNSLKPDVIKQQLKQDFEVNYNDPLLYIHGKSFNLSTIPFKEQIIESQELLSKLIDHKAQDIVHLKYLSPIEFYLLSNNVCENSTLQFNKEEICSICQFELFEIEDYQNFHLLTQDKETVVGLPCDHYFHFNCLLNCIKDDHIQCPMCFQIYGIKTGDQPEGQMLYYLESNLHCEGYEDIGTIVIEFHMYSGSRNDQKFPSTFRQAFLPDCNEGRITFRLLKIAFERKLIFTVGRSVTTGKDNRIIFNGIHLKTSLNGGINKFGYPDPTYFNRVQQELASKGVY